MDSVKRSDRGFSIRHCNWNICRKFRTLRIRKSLCHDFFKFHDFSTLRADCARLRVHRILKRLLLTLHLMIQERRPNVLTLFSRFYDLAVSRNPPSKSINREIWKNHDTFFFLIMRVRVIWQMFQFLQFMIEKPRPELLTLSTKFYDLSVSHNLFSKAKIRQFGEWGSEGLTSLR